MSKVFNEKKTQNTRTPSNSSKEITRPIVNIPYSVNRIANVCRPTTDLMRHRNSLRSFSNGHTCNCSLWHFPEYQQRRGETIWGTNRTQSRGLDQCGGDICVVAAQSACTVGTRPSHYLFLVHRLSYCYLFLLF